MFTETHTKHTLSASLVWPAAATLLISPFLSLVDDILQATWLGKLVFFLWMSIILRPFPKIKKRWGGGKIAQQICVPITRNDLDFILEAHKGQKEPVPQSCPLSSPHSCTLNKNVKQIKVTTTTIIKKRITAYYTQLVDAPISQLQLWRQGQPLLPVPQSSLEGLARAGRVNYDPAWSLVPISAFGTSPFLASGKPKVTPRPFPCVTWARPGFPCSSAAAYTGPGHQVNFKHWGWTQCTA